MARPLPKSDPPPDGPPLAFVLRLRNPGTEDGDGMVVQVDDVQSSGVWIENSLESAFDRIRYLVQHHLRRLRGPCGRSGEPN